MSENKKLREYWLLQHGGDACIYESLDEFPADGDKSLLVHVREVIDETEQADARLGRKYGFLAGTLEYREVTLRRIWRFSNGEIGGWIESEANLSHEGDCWVSDDAKVYDAARVSDDAKVSGNAQVFGNAKVSGNAQVYGDAEVYRGFIG